MTPRAGTSRPFPVALENAEEALRELRHTLRRWQGRRSFAFPSGLIVKASRVEPHAPNIDERGTVLLVVVDGPCATQPIPWQQAMAIIFGSDEDTS